MLLDYVYINCNFCVPGPAAGHADEALYHSVRNEKYNDWQNSVWRKEIQHHLLKRQITR